MKQPVENEDYQLVPVADDPDGWEVRLLTGPFPETIIRYGNVRLDGQDTEDDVQIRFGFAVISTPESDLTSENTDLQAFAGDVLHAIICQGLEDGTLMTKPRDK